MSGSGWRRNSNPVPGGPKRAEHNNASSSGTSYSMSGASTENVQHPATPKRNKKMNHDGNFKGENQHSGNRKNNSYSNRTPYGSSPKRQSNKKLNINRHYSMIEKNTESLGKSISKLSSASALMQTSTHHGVSDDADDVCREIYAIAHDLTTILGDAKAVLKDERLHAAYCMLFQGAQCIDQKDDNVLSKTPAEPSANNTRVWSCILNVISASLLNQHDTKYTPRKACKIKLSVDKVHTIFVIIVKPIAALIGFEWFSGITALSDAAYTPLRDIAPFLYQKEHHTEKLIVLLCCLRDYFMAFGFHLDSDQHVVPLVERILIPILSLDAKSISNDFKELTSVQDVLRIHTVTIEILVRILRWKQCSSALLAPLVVNVNARGVGQMKSNPLREQLLNSVITIINCDAYLKLDDTSWLCHTCQCLTSLLDNMNAVKGAANTKNRTTRRDTSDQVQMANVFKWVHKTLQCDVVGGKIEHSLWWYSLDLLKTVIRLYPESCAQYWSLFLPQYSNIQSDKPPSPSRSNNGKSSSDKRDLMSIISLDGDSSESFIEEKIISVMCCKAIVEALPLQLWSRSGYLQKRIESSLGVVIEFTTRYISRSSPSRERDSFYSLAVAILVTIPFAEYSLLVKQGIDLMNQIGRIYNMYGLHGGLGLEETVQTLSDCFGGKEKPDGGVTPLPIPVREWLKSQVSSTFISRLFNKMSDVSSHEVIEKGVQTLMQMNLFVQVVRSAHWILGDENSTRMKSFLTLTKMLLHSDDASLKVIGCELLAAFIEGTKSVADQGGNKQSLSNCLPSDIYVDLYSVFLEKNSNVLCSAFSTYLSLDYTTWMELLVSNHNPLPQILPIALEYSGSPEAKVRSEACRALGNIMSVLVRGFRSNQSDSSTKDLLSLHIEGTLQVTGSATEDSDANVRSMAMFAIGNVALDTVESKDLSLLTRLPFMKLCDATYSRLFDENEKVINNAIRTSGHLFKLAIFRPNDHIPLLSRCSQFLSAMGTKVERAILDVTNVTENRSWKHRLNAKKQAWGACQAFDPILLFAAKAGGLDGDSMKVAVSHLINCVEYSDQINEKIALSAVKCLSNIDAFTWRHLSTDDGIQGHCLAACLTKVESKALPILVRDHLSEMIGDLLHNISDEDILSCFNHNDISQEHIHYLYGWMVDQDLESNIFESFGRVLLLHPSIQMDVSIAQRFQSRATYAARKRRPSGGNLDDPDCFDEDSEEDEL